MLPKLAKRQAELVAELTLLWKDPTDRLTKVKESDPQSFLVSTGWREGDDDGGAVDGQDTRSEFSAASNVSYVSFASNASSHQSGTSTVSVLSNVSLSRGVPSSAASNSAFSISGIEHSLLSRGKSERPNTAQLTKGGQVRKVSDKRQQRWDRKKSHRQFGSDPMNLKTELTICEELWSLAHFDVLATETVHLCEALVLLSGKSTYSKSKLPEAVAMKLTENSVLFSTDSNISLTSDSSSVYLSDSMLAALLQSAVDDHAAHVRSHTPPVGPPYPVHFLVRKNMTVLQRFQDEMSDTDVPGGLFQANKNTAGSSNISKLTIPIKSYWQVAADGILLWQSMRKLSLN